MAQYFEKVSPESCGISSKDLLRFIEGMEDLPELKETHGFMLIRHGKLLTEGYFAPYTEDMPHSLFSSTKTFVQLAIGFMVQEGLISIEDKISDYFKDRLPENISVANKNLLVRHLLMMATGHRGQTLHQGGDFTDMNVDKVKEFFETDSYIEAGVEFQYDNIATYVLSSLVSKLTGKNVAEYLKPRFLEPLGITIDYYSADADNVCIGYAGFRIKLEDFAKLGQFFLNGGVWEGKRLLSEEWCKQAIAKHTDCEGPCGEDWKQGYCWQMWRGRHNTARLCGAFGQMCVIAPDKDLIFATLSGGNFNKLQYILNNFYDNVYHKIKDEPLEENQVGNIKLENKIDSLKLVDIFAPVSKRAEILNRKELKFEKRGRYNTVKFDFEEDVCKVTLSGDCEISFDAGLKSAKQTYIEDGGFMTIDPYDHGTYYATARFDENDNFIITVRILETPTMIKIEVDKDENVKLYTLRGELD